MKLIVRAPVSTCKVSGLRRVKGFAETARRSPPRPDWPEAQPSCERKRPEADGGGGAFLQRGCPSPLLSSRARAVSHIPFRYYHERLRNAGSHKASLFLSLDFPPGSTSPWRFSTGNQKILLVWKLSFWASISPCNLGLLWVPALEWDPSNGRHKHAVIIPGRARSLSQGVTPDLGRVLIYVFFWLVLIIALFYPFFLK